MEKPFSVAIDGPSGAGKSTIARAAARRFGFIYVDTGAIYRTLGLAVRRAGLGQRAGNGPLVAEAALVGAAVVGDEYRQIARLQ